MLEVSHRESGHILLGRAHCAGSISSVGGGISTGRSNAAQDGSFAAHYPVFAQAPRAVRMPVHQFRPDESRASWVGIGGLAGI